MEHRHALHAYGRYRSVVATSAPEVYFIRTNSHAALLPACGWAGVESTLEKMHAWTDRLIGKQLMSQRTP